MPEFDSRQIAALAANPSAKVNPFDHGKVMALIATTPAAVAWAQDDTFEIGMIPRGSRILRDCMVRHAAMGSSVTLVVGTRTVDGTVIDADGIFASASVASASAGTLLNTGAQMVQANGFVTTVDTVVYATLAGATPTANAQMEFDLRYIGATA